MLDIFRIIKARDDLRPHDSEKEGKPIKHLGDITKLNGAEMPVVDVITGGSPCQDLSVAGKRAGLKHEDHGDEETTRSGLFMDQVRIMKEMREHDRAAGRTGEYVRPRYMVWENVPGAFSSNHGRDFQAVLGEIIKIAEPKAPSVPLPEAGRWPNAGCLYDDMGKWSLAWRVHDAQYFGVAQRRKRISLLFDAGGLTAPWIMFEPEYQRTTEDGYPDETESDTGAEPRSKVQPVGESLPGYSEPSGKARKETAGGAGEGAESAGGAGCLNPWDIQSKRVISADGTADALYSGERRYGGGEAYVLDQPETICLEGNGARASHQGAGFSESDVMYTLNTIEQHGVLPVAVDVYNQTIEGDVSPTVTAAVGGTNTSGPKIMAQGVVSKGNGEAFLSGEKAMSISTGGGQAGQGYPAVLVEEPIVLESNQNHATVTDNGVSPTLPASMGMGGGYVPMVAEKHAISFQERAGKPGGGKGILIQDEHTGALSTLNIQHVLSLETYHCESEEDKAMTLKARDYKDPQSVYCVQRGERNG